MDLDNFPLPDGAHEALKRHGTVSHKLGDGIERITGHDRGVAFRIFPGQVLNQLRTDLAGGIPMYDEIEMIQFFNDKFTRPVFILTKEHKRKYKVEYERYLAGKEAVGLPLERWGQCTSAEAATFASQNIFTVEQLAACPDSRIRGRFPTNFVVLYEAAIKWVAGQSGRFELEKTTEKMADMARENTRLANELENLRAQFSDFLSKPAKKVRAPKKSKGEH